MRAFVATPCARRRLNSTRARLLFTLQQSRRPLSLCTRRRAVAGHLRPLTRSFVWTFEGRLFPRKRTFTGGSSQSPPGQLRRSYVPDCRHDRCRASRAAALCMCKLVRRSSLDNRKNGWFGYQRELPRSVAGASKRRRAYCRPRICANTLRSCVDGSPDASFARHATIWSGRTRRTPSSSTSHMVR